MNINHFGLAFLCDITTPHYGTMFAVDYTASLPKSAVVVGLDITALNDYGHKLSLAILSDDFNHEVVYRTFKVFCNQSGHVGSSSMYVGSVQIPVKTMGEDSLVTIHVVENSVA